MSQAFDAATRARNHLKAWVVEKAYPLWWTAGADPKGGFFEKVGQDGDPVEGPRRGRVQPRQIYAYSIAGELGWSGPWREAVKHGLAFYLSAYRRPDGLFRALVGQGGVSLDESATLYDQAFAMFAAAAVAGSFPEQRDEMHRLATDVREKLIAERKHSGGGFYLTSPSDGLQGSNEHMHLLEASLAWAELGAGAEWRVLADEIVELALTKFIHVGSGQIREFFDIDWNPAPGDDGRICEPGHQFEWGWLLLRWGKLADNVVATNAGLRMIDAGEAHGIDGRNGVAINALLDDFSAHDVGARLWPQTERIKAAVLAAEITGDARYWRMAVAGAEGLSAYLETPIEGVWRDKMLPTGRFVEEPAPASSFYHITCAIAELDRAVRAAS